MAKSDTATRTAAPVTTGFIQYLLVAGLVAYAWYAYDQTGAIVPWVLLVPAFTVLLPPLQRRIGLSLGPGISVALALAFLVGMGGWAGWIKQDRQEASRVEQEKAAAARVAKLKNDRTAEYAANKPKIIAEVEGQLAENRPREAAATIAKFMTVTKDPDLGRLQHRAEVQVMKLDLQDEAKLPLERLQQIYAALAREDFANKLAYEAKLKGVEAELEKRRIQQEKQAKREALQESVKSQFSGIDGAHRGVEAAIKARLKDPSSYEHVSTRHIVESETFTVYTTYRARNSFNAVVTEMKMAVVDANGNVMLMQ